jgi:hypothetical protein
MVFRYDFFFQNLKGFIVKNVDNLSGWLGRPNKREWGGAAACVRALRASLVSSPKDICGTSHTSQSLLMPARPNTVSSAPQGTLHRGRFRRAGQREKQEGEWRARRVIDTRTMPNRRLPCEGVIIDAWWWWSCWEGEPPQWQPRWSIARTARSERGLHGRATAAFFDIFPAIHPRSIKPLCLRIPISNRPAPFISPLLSD